MRVCLEDTYISLEETHIHKEIIKPIKNLYNKLRSYINEFLLKVLCEKCNVNNPIYLLHA